MHASRFIGRGPADEKRNLSTEQGVRSAVLHQCVCVRQDCGPISQLEDIEVVDFKQKKKKKKTSQDCSSVAAFVRYAR